MGKAWPLADKKGQKDLILLTLDLLAFKGICNKKDLFLDLSLAPYYWCARKQNVNLVRPLSVALFRDVQLLVFHNPRRLGG